MPPATRPWEGPRVFAKSGGELLTCEFGGGHGSRGDLRVLNPSILARVPCPLLRHLPRCPSCPPSPVFWTVPVGCPRPRRSPWSPRSPRCPTHARPEAAVTLCKQS